MMYTCINRVDAPTAAQPFFVANVGIGSSSVCRTHQEYGARHGTYPLKSILKPVIVLQLDLGL